MEFLLLCSDAVADICLRRYHLFHASQASFEEPLHMHCHPMSRHLEAAFSFDFGSYLAVHFPELEAYKASTTLANQEKEVFQRHHFRAHE